MSDRQDPGPELWEQLGHEFENTELLDQALTHPSAAHERPGVKDNERLEFLGDAVLDLVIGRILFEDQTDWQEGQLTRARAALVRTESLAARARQIDLGRYVRLGRTELQSGGAEKDRILANLFEAVVGALYLDAGIETVFRFSERVFAGPLAQGEAVLERDPKTRFQEWAHADRRETPTYRNLLDTGEDSAEDRFTVAVELSDEVWGTGTARTKKLAERLAAAEALKRTREDG